MGMFSWYTQDTHHRILDGEPYRVVMSDNKGNNYVETCYEGYGVFGGKDYYELLAEMNGYTKEYAQAHNKELREIGITIAFDGHPLGDNPYVLHPSLTEGGIWMGGEPPKVDPNQGWRSY